MFRRLIGMLVAFMLAISIASFAFARGAPNKKAFASKADAVIEMVAPTPVAIPLMSGYDVIQNISVQPRMANAQHFAAVTTDSRRLSSTVDWRSINAKSI